ncbi:MAG: hypothetical protein IT347_13015 [Candidatus Eisenbacteria bacterium]|nr:hypothetical protein [Candidatus Eisenbacteria bacterium]
MSDELLDDLIQRTLEGDASAAERERLESRMAADPAARGRYDELSRVFQALAGVRAAEPPAGLRDEVLRAVRGAAPAWAPAAARTGQSASPRPSKPLTLPRRSTFAWLRVALPAAAALVAVFFAYASWRGAGQPAGGGLASGAMSGASDLVRIGPGDSAVLVRWSPSATGFQLRIKAGNSPVRIVLETLSSGALLSLAPDAPTPSPRVEANLPANALVVAEGTAPDTQATVRVSVTLPDGRLAAGEVRLRGLSPSR